MKKLTLLLLSVVGILGQSALTYTGTFQWTYGQTNTNFKLYAAFGTNTFSVLSLITNKTSSITSNLPANVDNRFYVNAVDSKTGLESVQGNVVTNRVNIVQPVPVTNLTVTITIP